MSKAIRATTAIAASAVATLIGLAQAQEGVLVAPTPTPIPETLPPAAPTPTPPAQEGTRGEQETTFDPQWVLWTPSSSVTFTVPYRQGQPSPITVRVSSDEGGLITSTARFVLAIDGIIGSEQPAVATSVVGTTTLDLTADIGNAPTGSLIRFRINKEDNTVLESPVYGIARRYFVFLPVTRRDEAQFVGAASACAAKASPNARLISQTVFYTPTVFFSDTWFYAENPNPNGIVQVRVRSYGGDGQVQVFYENPDCNNVLRMAPFGIAPNPVVTVSGVPTGPVYFRVVSPTVPATPFGIAWQAFPANTTACTAWSLPPNTTLSWTARNTNDYFAINLPGSDVFRIYVQGHPVTHTQVQLRSPISGTCPSASTSLVGPFGIVNNGTAFLATGTSGGGTYYIRVVTLTQQPGTQAYQIRWEPVRTERPVFSTNPDQPQNCVTCAPDLNLPNPPVGGTRTYYWFRLNRTREGVDRNLLRVEIQIAGVNDLQPCPPGNPAAVAPYNTGNWVNISNSPYGAVTLQFNQAGGYNIRIRALDTSNAEYYYDAKPLRVGCG